MLLSVWITTYNHEKYIAQALESVLMQETAFDVEIVIGDDCSTDRTRDIINSFANTHPGKFRLFYPEHNLGMIEMFKASYAECTGKYIAWLDGDDFWTDRLKLQKQVDFLEEHSDFVMCFHDVMVQDEIAGKDYLFPGPNAASKGDVFLIDHFLKGFNPVPAASVVHRNAFGRYLPDWLYTLPYPDFSFYFLLLQKGKFKRMTDRMAVYRVHKMGSYRGNSNYFNYQNLIKFFLLIKLYIPSEHKQTIERIAGHYYFELFKLDINNRTFRKAGAHALAFIKHDKAILYKRHREMLATFKKLLFKPK